MINQTTGSTTYYYCNSVWSQPDYTGGDVKYVVTSPPAGGELRTLVEPHSVTVDGKEYFVSNHVFYQRITRDGQLLYVTVDAPPGAKVPTIPQYAVEVTTTFSMLYWKYFSAPHASVWPRRPAQQRSAAARAGVPAPNQCRTVCVFVRISIPLGKACASHVPAGMAIVERLSPFATIARASHLHFMKFETGITDTCATDSHSILAAAARPEPLAARIGSLAQGTGRFS